MKVGAEGAFLELEVSEFGGRGTPAEHDFLMNITVQVNGFSGADQVWILLHEWEVFLAQLTELDRVRQGRAVLSAVMPEECQVEFFSTDRAGHMALRGHVRRPTCDGFDLGVEFGFAFEPDGLPAIVAELMAFTSRP